ncbi:MAG: hypothetical protein JXB48_04045 [Candidatus Latescibacteria bacterium]|nr:hypothetical protein [Candidatus Latescibacterota bacterium]
MVHKKIPVRFLIILLLLYSSILHAQNRQIWLKHEFPYLTAEGTLWIGTPKGLYQYHDEEDTWAVYGEHNGLPSNDIKILLWDGEFLWVATSKGIASGDIKLNKWLTYTVENGLPSNTVYTIAHQEDYIWIGTDNGAARFDKLIQEWEMFDVDGGLPDAAVHDIAVDGDLVYMATGKGLAEYNTRFEKWRYFGQNEGIISEVIQSIYATTDFLWLFTDKGITRFNKKLHTSISYSDDPRLFYPMINDFAIDGEKLWLATQDGIVIYDPDNNLWRNYQEEMNLPGRFVKAFSFTQENRWFITDNGIVSYDETGRSWQRYDRTRGLSSENYEIVTEFQGRVFLINDSTIDYLKSSENRWYVYTLKESADLNRSSSSFLSLDRTKGSFIQINPDTRFSISGSRFTYRHQRSYTYNAGDDETDISSESIKRSDLKAQLTLPEGRTVNGFYNDTDFSQILYGIRYRGNAKDLVQEANWGDVRHEQGRNNLVPSVGIFGVSTRLETGKKTERFKRSLVSARAVSGEKTTGFETDFFTGNFESSGVTLSDIDYIKNRYFDFANDPEIKIIDENSVTVYVDDNNCDTNTVNTLLNLTVAGISGDYDRFTPYIHYTINFKAGEIRFLEPLSDESTIAIKGSSQGIPFERIIQKPGEVENVMVNRYFIGGYEIVPHTFNLEIFDKSGSRYTLHEFGLDENNDGRVDPEKIDYKEGILSFPEKKPFPISVYDPVDPLSHYIFRISFQTEITIFNLSHNHLIRGSETCIIDGDILTGGEDYVLDYTSGTLLIIKEGIVAEDSEIEVQYDYYRDSDEQFQIVGAGISPSDNLQMEINYFGFDQDVSYDNPGKYSGIDYFGEFRWQAHDVDFKVKPEAARTQGEGREGNSLHIRTDASAQKFRVFSEYEQYDREFEPLFEKKFRLGTLQDRTSFGGTIYPVDFLDITGNWNRRRSPSSETEPESIEEDRNGKILFRKLSYPALSLSLRNRTQDTGGYNSEKDTFKGDFEYQIPSGLLNKVKLKSLRVYGVWRRSRENIENFEVSSPESDDKKIYDNRYIRFDFAPVNLVRINSYYREKTVRSQNDSDYITDRLLDLRQKLFFDVTVDRIKGLNMNVRSEGEITENYPASTVTLRNRTLYNHLQSNFRFFPGQWIALLNPFTFEFNYQPTWRGYYGNIENRLNWSEKFLSIHQDESGISSEQNDLYQFRGEWRPTASLLFYLGYDIYDIESRTYDSTLLTDLNRINHKVEYRPTMYSLITFQYLYDSEEKRRYSTTSRNNPMIWLENRWNENLQTKINLSYRNEEKHIGNIRENTTSYSPLAGLTYRIFRNGTGASKAEIRNDLSAAIFRSDKLLTGGDYNSYSNAFAIDYFPVSVLIVRFKTVLSYKDQLNFHSDTFSTRFEMRLTAQF